MPEDYYSTYQIISSDEAETNNFIQIAKCANENGKVYEQDINDASDKVDEIWEITKEILKNLANIYYV